MSDLAHRFLSGAAAGLAATTPMTVVMEAIRRVLPVTEQDPHPPRQITERAAAAVGIADDLTGRQLEGATTVAHFAYGTGAGAVYGLLAPHLPGGPAVRGVGYGLAVWAGGYLGWLPATGLYKQPEHEPGGRHLETIVSHVVWGAVLGLIQHQLGGEDDEGIFAAGATPWEDQTMVGVTGG
jgi:hypothetical protein